MKEGKNNLASMRRDAAVAAAAVIVEEFFPHCPNGIAEAVHDRVREIVEAAVESVESAHWQNVNEPSMN